MAALVKAIEQKRFKQAKLLLKLGDNVNQQEQLSGRTPLLAVCFVEDENLACRITKKLLHRGADVCMQDVYGMSPLMEACKLGKEELVKVLIQSEECDFAATDNTGNTALIHSVDAGNSRITKALTEAMNIYDVRAADKPNNKGETPLIRAMKLKQNACREVLLSDGKASPNARDFDLKLNAKEWEFYLNEKEENENEDKINIEKNKSNFWNVLHREQNRDRRVKSRPSSIINYRQNLTSTARPERHSVSFTFDCNDVKCSEKFVRRTKSAPLVTCDNHKLLSRSGMFNFESSNAEKSISKSGFPEKKTKVCFENNTIHDETISKQNGWNMATTGRSYKHHEKSCAVEESLSSAVAVTEQRKMACETGSEDNGKRVSSSQSQLPQLFTLMTEQTTHSFRSSAKTRAPAEQSRKWSSREGKGSYRRRTPRRNSTAIQKQYPSSRRWSTAESSLIALGRYSSLYSRSDFKALNPDNVIILEKSASKTRRSSVQSTPEELLTNVKKAQRKSKAAAISPNLLKLNPVLSTSLPNSSGSGRIKSARPRCTARHNSDPLLAGNTFLSGSPRIVATTPVIEEIEEGGDGEN